MRTLRNAELDVVLLTLFGASAAAILVVCLLGLVNLSKNWEGDVLDELLPLRAGIAHKMSKETMPFRGRADEVAKSKRFTAGLTNP